MIFNGSDEESQVTHDRLAERHIHRDRLVAGELAEFWGCVAFAAKIYIPPDMWIKVAPGKINAITHS